MAIAGIHQLLIEQESALDTLFDRMAKAVAAAIASGPTVNRASVLIVARAEVAKLFGATPHDTLTSPIGVLIQRYANAGRTYAIRRLVAYAIEHYGADRNVELVRLAVADALVMKQVHAYLDLLFTYAERPHTTSKRTRRWSTPLLPPDTDPRAERIISATATIGAVPRIHDAALTLVTDATLRNHATLTVIAQNGVIPKALDDTARWIDPKGRVLADRLWIAAEDVIRHIDTRLKAIERQPPGKAARSIATYLSATYTPTRTKSGRLRSGQRPGGVSRTGRGQGSYGARRIGRHELTLAHGTIINALVRTSDLLDAVKWDLNPAHLATDECDDNAEGHSTGLPPGCYYPGEAPFYPSHIGCVVGETRVAGPELEIGYRRTYSGLIVTLRMQSGKSLTLTPNHPVLTTDGWVPAGLLHKGADIVSGSLSDRRLSGASDNDDVPPTIKKVLNTITVLRQSTSLEVPISTKDFHGDVSDSKVNVVCVNGALSDGDDPPRFEHHLQEHFIGAPMGLALLASDRTLPATFDRIGASALGIVGVRQDTRPFIGGDIALTDLDGLGQGSALDPGALQSRLDSNSRHAESCGQFLLSHPIFIETNKLIDVDVAQAEGLHVYNLQTKGGWYYANGIIVHNCLCLLDAIQVNGKTLQE